MKARTKKDTVRATIRRQLWARRGGRRTRTGKGVSTRASVNMSPCLEELESPDDYRRAQQGKDQQVEGDGRGPVEVGLLERVVVRQLVGRPARGDHAPGRARDEGRLHEDLGAGRDGEDDHVSDPLGDERELDPYGQLQRIAPVQPGRLDQVDRDVV